jgi:AAA family ATP:ADP antiporter
MLGRVLVRVVDVREREASAVVLGCAYFFFVLASWYVLRPVRDEMGAAGGVQNLAWLFTGTLLLTLVANPLFSLLVARLRVRRFVPLVYHFFGVNLFLFLLLFAFASPNQNVWLGRVFFVWTSVFNLFVVSVFWACMADAFRPEQAKRLFGFVGVGGTLGGITGAAATAALAGRIGTPGLLLLSIVLLECAVICAIRFFARTSSVATDTNGVTAAPDTPIGGGVLAGITHVWRSPYLLGICLYMLLFTVGSTFLYFQQAAIVSSHVADRAARTTLFAQIDLAVNILTALTQIFVTGRLLKIFGVAFVLALLPALSVLGFLGVGLLPTLWMVIGFQVARRAGNFAVASPTREVLFTVVTREDKYKTKNFIDTFVYRAGDQLGAWTSSLLALIGFGIVGTSFVAAPLAAAWLLVSVWLGRKQSALARDSM